MKRSLFLTLLMTLLMPCVMFAQNHTLVVTDTTVCGSFTWAVNGQTYTATTTTSYSSGDTLYMLHAIINPVYNTPTCTTSVNGGCTYTFGNQVLSSNGIYTGTLQTVDGCDSAAAINLTVSTSSTKNYTVTACGSYTWHDSTYTASTTRNIHETDASGCDSNLTLNLTIIEPTQLSSDTVVNGCDLLYFRFSAGFPSRIQQIRETTTLSTETFATPGSVFWNSFHGRTIDQCFDSVRTAHITINHKVYTPQVVNACDDYSFTANGTTHYYTYNVAADTLLVGSSAQNCDSSVILNITIHKSPVVTIEGDLNVTPGSDVSLTATCDQSGVTYRWMNGSTEDHIELSNITSNYDVSITVNNTATGCTGENFVTILANAGIDDVTVANVNLYPNPVTTSLTISCDNATVTHVELLNMEGRRVLSMNQPTNGVVDLSSISNGVYLLRLSLSDGTTATRKVVISK